MSNWRFYTLVFMLLVSGLAAPASLDAKKPKKAAKEYIYPGPEGWTWASPSKYGYDSLKLEKARDYLINKTNATGVVVCVGGEMIFKYGDITSNSYIASCRKSVLAMLYGKYVENGTVDLNRTIGELGITDVVEKGYEQYPDGLMPIEKKATIDDIITARSGVYHEASNEGSSAGKIERGTMRPGTKFLYNNWDFNVGGTILEQLTGRNIYDILEEDLALPIEMEDWDRSIQKKAGNTKLSIHKAYHFRFSTRDMARIAYLMLREGKWKDKQVISKQWCKKITSPVSSYKEVAGNNKKGRYSYGYMWWLFDAESPLNDWDYVDGYTALGYMGQYIMVFPHRDMVVAIKTDARYGRRMGTGSPGVNFVDLVFKARNK